MSQHLNRIVQAFKEEKGFDRLFSLFYEKYRSYERVEKSVTIVLEQPNESEKDAIGGLLGEDLSKNTKIKLTASKFEKAIKKTKYGILIQQIPLQKIIETYFGGELQSKREEQEKFLRDRIEFFDEYKKPVYPRALNEIVIWAEKKENKLNRYYAQYKQDNQLLKSHLGMLSSLFSLFPLKEPMYLPIFAAKVTRDPHAFDIDEEAGKFLIYTLQVLKEIESGEEIKGKLNAEEITSLFLEYNILRDDLFNDVTIYNVGGTNKNGSENYLLKGLQQEKATINLPLKDVLKLSKITARNNTIFMVENSSVASYLISNAIKENKDVSIVCGNGVLNTATLKFLDIYVNSGGMICYASDFDPEGLLISEQLLQRYQESISLWRMTKEDYLNAKSNKKISSSSMAKLLNNYTDENLTTITNEMIKYGKAGYQENIIEELIKDIQS